MLVAKNGQPHLNLDIKSFRLVCRNPCATHGSLGFWWPLGGAAGGLHATQENTHGARLAQKFDKLILIYTSRAFDWYVEIFGPTVRHVFFGWASPGAPWFPPPG